MKESLISQNCVFHFFESSLLKICKELEFLGGLAVRILSFHCRGPGSIPSQGTEIPQATRCGQKKKKNCVKSHVKSLVQTLAYIKCLINFSFIIVTFTGFVSRDSVFVNIEYVSCLVPPKHTMLPHPSLSQGGRAALIHRLQGPHLLSLPLTPHHNTSFCWSVLFLASSKFIFPFNQYTDPSLHGIFHNSWAVYA